MMLCDSGQHCVQSDPAEYRCTCPLLQVPMLLHCYYLMSRIYISRMSTSLNLSEILLKQEAGRRTSKKPSFCLLLTSKAHTGNFDLTNGRLASSTFTNHSLWLANTRPSCISCIFLSRTPNQLFFQVVLDPFIGY